LRRVFDQDIALDITRPPIQVEVQILDVSIFGEQVRNVLLRGLFVDVCRDHDPAFDTADGDGVLGSAGLGAGIGLLAVGGRGCAVLAVV